MDESELLCEPENPRQTGVSSMNRICSVLVVGAIALSASMPAAASVRTSVFASFDLPGTSTGVTASSGGPDLPFTAFTRTHKFGGDFSGTGTAHAESVAIPGALGGSASAISDSLKGQPISTSVRTQAAFLDTLTINSPDLAGTEGAIVFNVNIAGSFAGTSGTSDEVFAGNQGQWNYTLMTIPQTVNFGFNRWQIFDNFRVGGGPLPSSFAAGNVDNNDDRFTTGLFTTTPLPFVYGAPFTLQGIFGVGVASSADSFKFGFLSAAMSNSADLSGIQSVKDSSGALVTNFTIGAESGTDYTQPLHTPSAVPLPASAPLLASMLFGFIPFRRRTQTGRV
jgi:hypothetical protein